MSLIKTTAKKEREKEKVREKKESYSLWERFSAPRSASSSSSRGRFLLEKLGELEVEALLDTERG